MIITIFLTQILKQFVTGQFVSVKHPCERERFEMFTYLLVSQNITGNMWFSVNVRLTLSDYDIMRVFCSWFPNRLQEINSVDIKKF